MINYLPKMGQEGILNISAGKLRKECFLVTLSISLWSGNFTDLMKHLTNIICFHSFGQKSKFLPQIPSNRREIGFGFGMLSKASRLRL